MSKLLLPALLLSALAGCASGGGHEVYGPLPNRPAANLALGPAPYHTWLAESYARRSSWPSVHAGYKFDDVSTFSEVIYDDQSFYDWRYGGGYTRESISVRSGVVVR